MLGLFFEKRRQDDPVGLKLYKVFSSLFKTGRVVLVEGKGNQPDTVLLEFRDPLFNPDGGLAPVTLRRGRLWKEGGKEGRLFGGQGARQNVGLVIQRFYDL